MSKFFSQYRNMSTDSKTNDCMPCRLVSGFGLLGISAYIYTNAKRPRKWENNSIKFVSAVTCALGIARLADMDFLKANKGKD